MPEFTVLINTRDHPEQIRCCLDALKRQTLDPNLWDILVIDDGSLRNEPTEIVRSWSGPVECRAIRIAPSGRAHARNVGLEEARGRMIVFLGDDTYPEPDFLEEHLSAHRRHPKAAVVGRRTEASDMPSKVFREWWDNLRYQDIEDPNDATFAFFYTCTASVDREALLATGGFDENFTRYGWEDLDLGLRLEKRGLRIVYHPEARAEHHHPNVSLNALCRREYEQAFTACYFFNKWPNEPLVQRIPFWRDRPRELAPGPEWRRTLARGAIHVLEKLGPVAECPLRTLYNRLMISCRCKGLRDGRAFYEPLFQRYARGERNTRETSRRFQK